MPLNLPANIGNARSLSLSLEDSLEEGGQLHSRILDGKSHGKRSLGTLESIGVTEESDTMTKQ